jgi:hypothetical protein
LRNRDGDKRTGEKIIQFLGVGPQIEAADMGIAMVYRTVDQVKEYRETTRSYVDTIENKAILNYLKQKRA